jgi:succinate dehydrogenase/fumarate reductase flavoprotein subunit
VRGGPFDPAVKDGMEASGLVPPKSNWAQRLDAPPYLCFPVTCSITFTFGGVAITPDARVVDVEGRPIPGLYACGELVGGLFYHNYPGGSGLMSGAVFGRLAGRGAATMAQARAAVTASPRRRRSTAGSGPGSPNLSSSSSPPHVVAPARSPARAVAKGRPRRSGRR